MDVRLAWLIAAAGACGHAGAQPGEHLSPVPRTLKARPVADIYYNLRTGERVVSPAGAGTRSASIPLWINNNDDPCGTGPVVDIIDAPDADGDTLSDFTFGTPCSCDPSSPFYCQIPCEGSWNVWWGDIAADSVVDCIVVAYGIVAPDTDLDVDGVGDGIPGYDLILTFSDNDNGFGYDGPGASARSCILELTIPSIPGALPDDPPYFWFGYIATYTLTLDLANTAPSFIFELGDSDGIDDAGTGLSGGALYGHPTFSDRDADTLHDFSYSIRFDQSSLPPQPNGPVPGMTKGINGVVTVAPRGCAAGPCPTPTDPAGVADAVDIYSSGPSCPPSITPFIGTYFFGGFSCQNGTPHASAYLELYGTPALACSPADNAPPFGILDFSDVLGFVLATAPPGSSYAAGFAPPDDAFDFNDVIAFLEAFAAGCP